MIALSKTDVTHESFNLEICCMLKTKLDHCNLSRNKTMPNFSNSLKTLKYYIESVEMEYLITESIAKRYIVQQIMVNE
jgi:hypothetical protein